MLRIGSLCIVALVLLLTGCGKNNASNESLLYGTWVKGSHAGDTLLFVRAGNKNLLRYNLSFNPYLPTYTEMEYSYTDGKLAVALFGASQPLQPVSSFTWKQVGKEFEVQGIQLFIFMSASNVYFTYTKIN